MQKAYRVEWRPLAHNDLRGIIQYIASGNKQRAETFNKALRGKVARLAQFPELGRAGRISGTRELVVHPNYIVFYRVLDDTRMVQILRVKHAAQQWPATP